jgi:hypothetical protein
VFTRIPTEEEYAMHPEIAKSLIAQHHDELMHATEGGRSNSAHHLFPRWHVSWTRAVLAPPAAGSSARAGQGSHRGSSLVIIISAHRSA